MAQISEFAIEGLAGRSEPFSAVLNRDVNIFFGLNGSGKTTLLKILHSSLSTETDILRDLPFTRARVKVALNRYRGQQFVREIRQPQASSQLETKTPQVSAPTLFGGSFLLGSPGQRLFDTSPLGAETITLSDIGWTSDPPEPDGGNLTQHKSGFLPISRLYRNVSTSTGGKRLSDQELDGAFARGLQLQWSEYYADIAKETTKAQERGLANILGFFLAGAQEQSDDTDAPDEAEAYKRISGFLERQPGFAHLLRSEAEFTTLYARRPELRNVVKHIERIEKTIAEISAPRERFRGILEAMFTGSKHLVFTDKEIRVELPKKKEIGLSLLSSGEKQLIFIALNALTGDNHCLIIDEPELSMHVDWQKRLVATLRDLNPRLQLIMATHSPEIMADIPDDKIFRI